jgi:hypothetical protein
MKMKIVSMNTFLGENTFVFIMSILIFLIFALFKEYRKTYGVRN